ncbi:MAG: DNA-binding protein [bacterium]
MKKIYFSLILISFFYLPNVYASISITNLIENARENDLKEVVIEGEIIGDIFYKGDFVWINVFDGSCAIGVWAPKKMAEGLSHPGDYNHKGDFVQITGNFNRACAEHRGETDIHLNSFIVLKKGESVLHPVDMKKLKITAGIFFLVTILFGVELFLRKRSKKNESEG